MLSAILTLVLYIKFTWEALCQTVFGVVDQTHYHVKTGKALIKALFDLVRQYLIAAPRLFITHFNHNVYLHRLGLDGVDNLKDNGTLVWMDSPSANKVDMKPTVRVTGFKNNASSNMEHLCISSSAMQKLWEALRSMPDFRFPETVFLDFGCGTGFAMIAAMTQPFNSVIGVELDAKCAEMAEQNIEISRMSPDRTLTVRCQDFHLHHEDMCDFTYVPNMPKSYNTVVLHMYDPLWTLPKAAAHKIYMRVLDRAHRFAAEQHKRVIVAYFYAGWYNGDALPALKENNAQLLTSFDYDSLNFCCSSKCYLYELH